MTTEPTAINYKIGNERLISVTEYAARKLASLLEEKGKPEGALRLAVIGGGCSGLQYVMDLVDGPKERDILVPISNVRNRKTRHRHERQQSDCFQDNGFAAGVGAADHHHVLVVIQRDRKRN